MTALKKMAKIDFNEVDIGKSIIIYGDGNTHATAYLPELVSMEVIYDNDHSPRRVLGVIFRVESADKSMFTEISDDDIGYIKKGVGTGWVTLYRSAPFDYTTMRVYYHERLRRRS